MASLLCMRIRHSISGVPISARAAAGAAAGTAAGAAACAHTGAGAAARAAARARAGARAGAGADADADAGAGAGADADAGAGVRAVASVQLEFYFLVEYLHRTSFSGDIFLRHFDVVCRHAGLDGKAISLDIGLGLGFGRVEVEVGRLASSVLVLHAVREAGGLACLADRGNAEPNRGAVGQCKQGCLRLFAQILLGNGVLAGACAQLGNEDALAIGQGPDLEAGLDTRGADGPFYGDGKCSITIFGTLAHANATGAVQSGSCETCAGGCSAPLAAGVNFIKSE